MGFFADLAVYYFRDKFPSGIRLYNPIVVEKSPRSPLPRTIVKDDDADFRSRFFKLPVEVRVNIYSKYVAPPYPLDPEFLDDLLEFESSDSVAKTDQFIQDLQAHSFEIFLRHGVMLVDSDGAGLGAMIDGYPKRILRRIRHLRLSHQSHFTAVDQWLTQFDTTADWERGDMSAYEEISEEYANRLFSIPRQIAFDRLDSRWLPNLRTLTIDIGRIDGEPQPVYGFTEVLEFGEFGIRWSSWLDESEAVRNRRYRSILHRIQSRFPERFCKDLTVTVNAKMDPKPPPLLNWRMPTCSRPILYTRLSYRVADPASVKVHERWQDWQTLYGVSTGLMPFAVIPEKVEDRTMGWHGASAESPEATNIPRWTYPDSRGRMRDMHELVRA